MEAVSKVVLGFCETNSFPVPFICIEPGRSIVGDTGITLYTIGSVKTIPGYRTYVSIDGGMTDNPRYALYQSAYEAVVANKAAQQKDFTATIAGRCCESGDLIHAAPDACCGRYPGCAVHGCVQLFHGVQL